MSTRPTYLQDVDFNASSSVATIVISTGGITQVDSNCVLLVVAHMPTGITGTTLVGSAGQLGGTYFRLARHDSGVAGTAATEIWLGYNFPDTGLVSSSLTLTLSAAATNRTMRLSVARFTAPQTSAPTPVGAAVGASATTGTTFDPGGTVTPAVGDIVVQAHAHYAFTAVTGTTFTPSSERMDFEAGFTFTSAGVPINSQTLTRFATTATPHKAVLSVAATASWVELLAVFRPTYDTVAEAGHVYKGRDLRSLDTTGAP